MAKRQVPDFDGVAAFDEALARKNPDLVTRLGGPVAVVTTEASDARTPKSESVEKSSAIQDAAPTRTPPALQIVSPNDVSPKRINKRLRRRGVVARANGQELRRLTVYVDLALAQRLREHCFKHELNLSEVAAEALGVGLEALVRNGS